MKNRSLIFMLAALMLMPAISFAQKKEKKCCSHKSAKVEMPAMLNNTDTISYIIGADIARSFRDNYVDLNYDVLIRGLKDGRNKADTIFSPDQIQTIMVAWNQRMYQEKMKRNEEQSRENVEKGKSFLAENRTREGVKETPSGLQYKVIKEGEGDMPDDNDMVEVNYTGTLIDGTVFDATSKRGEPVEFAVNGVIPGWTEGLKLMKPGAVYMFYIPSELGYGDQKVGSIPPGSTLIFEVELLEVDKKE